MSFFKNKNILITGASQGLGALVAQELSKEDSRLILVSSSENKLKIILKKCKDSAKHNLFASNFQSNIEIKNMTNFVKKTFKKIDIIIHVAGGGLGISEILPHSEDYIKVFNLNLFSVFEINRELFPIMQKNKAGTIFHVGSIAANEAVGSISYNVSKFALSSYVRTLAKNVAKYNVCVTGINPGGFEYKNNAMDRLKKRNLKVYNEFIEKRIPLKRMPHAKELLPIIKTLIGKNNMMFTGNMISCDASEGSFYT